MEKYKSYTLCFVLDHTPYEPLLANFKQVYGTESYNLAEKLVLTQDVKTGNLIKHSSHVTQTPNIAKIVFYKNADTLFHPIEKTMGRWVVDFHEKVARYCSEKPRYSELRPFLFAHGA